MFSKTKVIWFSLLMCLTPPKLHTTQDIIFYSISFVHKLQTTKIKDFVMFILYNQLKLVIGLKSKAFFFFFS
jgi:hypothetical protein